MRNLLFALAACSALLACNSSLQPAPDGGAATSSCRACQASMDCSGGEECVSLNPSSVCTASCVSSADCASTDECVGVHTVEGAAAAVCIAKNNSCGTVPTTDAGSGTNHPDAGSGTNTHPDAGSGTKPDAGSGSNCSMYVAPTTASTCSCPSGMTCAANGCPNAEYCYTAFDPGACAVLPQSCGGPPPLVPALQVGGAVTSSLTASGGGTMDRLLFAVVGDTRAMTVDDVSSYPDAIIQGIYGALSKVTPQPPFVITTGDYAFATPGKGTAGPQYDVYLAAQKMYSGLFWPAMGNHECNGDTDSSCGPGSSASDANYSVWAPLFLTPIGESEPYYERDISSSAGVSPAWTAKFIFLAPNDWTTAQASFLTSALKKTTTYTFVIRHEPSAGETLPGDTMAPGTAAIDSALQGQAITLCIEGHSHTWYFYDTNGAAAVFPKEVIVGNGGAPPLTAMSDSFYGFTVISQRTVDNAIVGTNYSYTTSTPQGNYATFAVYPDGTEVP